MMLKFYMTPGSCSTGIHILLEEVEVPFEVTILNLPAGDHRQPCYLVINPKGTIPALMLTDGYVLTEFQAIAYWLARAYPRKGLLPEDAVKAATAMELMDYVVGTIHGQGYTRIFTTDTYLPPGLAEDEAQRWRSAIEARGQEIVDQGFKVIEARLSDEGYAVGPKLSIADAALFYVFFWADRIGLPLPERCAELYQRLRARPVVRQVLMEEGYR
ncbi:MAG TPA: glutathione S-transferase C-terminal domain-containing protein [Aquabacterium sp.]|uniref:glutathione S-transferase family protein n=1 Tax=Aquabacterium sp. TaxID=1872578 RepID=UPI002E2F3AEA|nr:glutathione S-transferase C-terminal domain-containing protein [Aquabacterium sp.]HEX5355458.1 glutathione S-transferase C-terminal domain-containing protein [Aquabacterium sp.]